MKRLIKLEDELYKIKNESNPGPTFAAVPKRVSIDADDVTTEGYSSTYSGYAPTSLMTPISCRKFTPREEKVTYAELLL